MSKARQFIKDYTRGCSNELCAVEDRYGKKVISYHEWLTPEQALVAVELEKEETIDKACEWLRQHMKTLPELSNKDLTKHTLWKRDEIIDKFKQAMEE